MSALTRIALGWCGVVLIMVAVLGTGCKPPPVSVATTPSVDLIVKPPTLSVMVGEKRAISVEASGSNLHFKWTVGRGTLNGNDSPAVMYTAPATPGEDYVSVVVSIGNESVSKTVNFDVIQPTPEITHTPTRENTATPTITITPPVVTRTFTPPPTRELGSWPPVIADFESCNGGTTLGGGAGASCPGAGCAGLNVLKDTYISESDPGCVARLEYHITEWSAYYMKIPGADFTPYHQLVFDVKADGAVGIPKAMKIELKRLCSAETNLCQEVSIKYVSGITDVWQTMGINLDLRDLDSVNYAPPLSAFTEMGELVFTFEAKQSGTAGVVFLDNIRVK
jgi:hypothetical protein